MIGAPASLTGRGLPSDVLRRAIAQGLTRWDRDAVVTPALASRWIWLDDGLTLILRVSDAKWSDGTPVRADTVVRQLKVTLARPGLSPAVRAAAAAIDGVEAVTPAVVEIRLAAQRPDLPVLLAQPAFALMRDGRGSGPLRRRPRQGGWRPLAWSDQPTRPVVRIRGEGAARALARFAAGDSQVVLGGTAADAPLLRESGVGTPVIDPADGLFALAVRRRTGLLATVEGRRALSLAIDRPALLATFGVEDWPALEASSDALATIALSSGEGLAAARATVAAMDQPPRLTIATPSGPGGRLLVAILTRQLARAGITLSTADRQRADLALIDAVAASPEPASTLEMIGCGIEVECGPALRFALEQLAGQPTAAGWRFWSRRAVEAAQADRPVIPLAKPLRWSLVAPGLPFTPNPRAIHPLTGLLPAASAGGR